MDVALAARLARRSGFGADADTVAALAKLDIATAVQQMLTADRTATLPTFDLVTVKAGPGSSKADMVAKNKQVSAQLGSLAAWWLQRMVSAPEPFVEKLTFTWHGHFATSVQKVRSAPSMARQNAFFRTNGLGDFRTLAYGMLVDPAMLRWLDGQENVVGAPNENLAREFMELFTLGHGDAYTEQDVREGARALTGWLINDQTATATLQAKRHDDGIKTVLGVTGPLDASGFCDAVLAQPGSARFLAGRLWARLSSDHGAPAPLIDRMASAYGPDRDIAAMLTTMFTSDEFAQAGGTIVASPLEWLVGALRTLQVPLSGNRRIRSLIGTLYGLGQRPFYPPSVGGWPFGQAWLSTAAADTRLVTATSLASVGQLPTLTGSVTSKVEAVGDFLGIPAWSDATAKALAQAAVSPVKLVAAALNTPENLSD